MDWSSLSQRVLEKLSDALSSGGPESPDALIEAEYGALLPKAIDAAGPEDDLSSLCVEALDKIYWARREREYFWVDLTETSTFFAFRKTLLDDPSREELDNLARKAEYELDHILRIGRHTIPDQPAMFRYATVLRAVFSSFGLDAFGAHYRASLLDRIYRMQNKKACSWLDALWKVSVLCAIPIDEDTWRAGIADSMDILPQHPVAVASSSNRVESTFGGMDVTVTIAEDVTLTEEQRETLRICVEQSGGDMAVVLIGDRTCIALGLSEARYGYDYLVESLVEEIAFYRSQLPEHSVSYLGNGVYLMSIFDTLLQVIKPGEYPEPPEALRRGIGIPLPAAHEHRDRALTACAIPSALAAAVPNRTLPDCDDPMSRTVEVCSKHGIDPGEWCAWYYYDDEHWPDKYGRIRYEHLEGIWHMGEGVDGERYPADAFIECVGDGHAVGSATDARSLLSVLKGDACIVTEMNGRAIDGLSRRERCRIERFLGLQPANCESEVIRELRNLHELTFLASNNPLLMIGAEEELQDSDLTHYFRFCRGIKAVRWALRSADIDVIATLANVERLCESPEGAYLNPEAAEMRTLLSKLVEADGWPAEDGKEATDHVQQERPQKVENHVEAALSETRRQQEIADAEVRHSAWCRQIITVSKETVRRLGIGFGDSDHEQLREYIKGEVAWFAAIQPSSLSEALLYLTYIADIDHCDYASSDDDAAVARRLIWEYVNRTAPDQDLWTLGLCNRTPSGGYLKSGDQLRPGCSALVIDGPLRDCKVIVSAVGKSTCEVWLEAFGRETSAHLGKDELLMIDPVPSVVYERAKSLVIPPLPESAVPDASRTLVTLFEFARAQPETDSLWDVSKYCLEACMLIRRFHISLSDIRNDPFLGANAEHAIRIGWHQMSILNDYPLNDPPMKRGCSVTAMLRNETPVEDCFEPWKSGLARSLLAEVEGYVHADAITSLE